MKLISDAFDEQGTIPIEHTEDGANASPPLRWSELPPSTRSLALWCEDVKSTGEPRFTHWIVYHVPPSLGALPEDLGHEREPQIDGHRLRQGANSLGNVGYDGPSPAVGSPHRYRFRLVALDAETELDPGADADALARAIEGHVIDEAELMAKYARPRAHE